MTKSSQSLIMKKHKKKLKIKSTHYYTEKMSYISTRNETKKFYIKRCFLIALKKH